MHIYKPFISPLWLLSLFLAIPQVEAQISSLQNGTQIASPSNSKNTVILLGQDTTKRPLVPAVPFLVISPDARASGMGEAGVATSADANAVYWNPAKLVFVEKKYGFTFSYSPWLRSLVNDMFLTYLSSYVKLDEKQSIAFALRYFNLGDVQFNNINGTPIGDFTPRELSLVSTYARKLSKRIGIAVGGRFIYSNLTTNFVLPNQQEAKAGITGAADIAFFYENKDLQIAQKPASIAFGINISNIGAKVSYSNINEEDFIPTNFRMGSAFSMALDPFERNHITFALDFNKLLIPSPPARDQGGNIVTGTDPRERTLVSGIFGSFSDAPDGFREELQEITTSLGIEYTYQNQAGEKVFMARAGYFNEHENKGARKYFTIGAGFNYEIFGLDISYLIPQSQNQNIPLAETLRFTASLDFPEKEK